ncbi:tRNA lysidine(34) synthetase TilS [Marinobacter caseinilyticus]|uniref:tRNA lysidine(34) synthetase TilS n=1 Tax=Marinobacter caseinilyticus TaxID=2692195 RepID=UPI001F1EF273|nr:tRNA lysidine(34) synthetase TilS [Marinobacter caseinilyticus]
MTPGGNYRPGNHVWPSDLTGALQSLQGAPRIWVAFSGGLDSTLLLHLAHHCLGNAADLQAVHVNHQLQPNAADCEAHCRFVCATLSVPLTVETLDLQRQPNAVGGLEEAARDARYGVFEQVLAPGDVLVMAHHADDQAETVLFRLLRGTGVGGLSGMPAARTLGAGKLVRPLLGFSRGQLAEWAEEAGLTWLDDPSNQDLRFDRNFLRHRILAPLKERWPTLLRRIRRSAESCRESNELSHRLAVLQLAGCTNEKGRIELNQFVELSALEQRNALRWWIADQGLAVPTMKFWHKSLPQLIGAQKDGSPEIRGDGFVVRRYREGLYLVRDGVKPPEQSIALVPDNPVMWGDYRCALVPVTDHDQPSPPVLYLTPRQGGEVFRDTGLGPSRPLKKWLQEQGVPPWERARLPLFWEDRSLVGIGSLWRSPRFAGHQPESGWRILCDRDFN